MPLSKQALTIANSADKEVDTIDDLYNKEMSGVMSTYQNGLVSYNASGDNLNPAQNKKEINDILKESGYYLLIAELLTKGTQDIIDISSDMYTRLYNKPFRFKQESLAVLNILNKTYANQFMELGTKINTQANSLITRNAIGGISNARALLAIEKLVSTGSGQLSTWLTTAIQSTNAEANVRLAEDNGFKEFEYVGVRDTLTRPFCRRHIGGIRTKEGWNSLDNGQINPVSTFRGGFNCRHSLIGI